MASSMVEKIVLKIGGSFLIDQQGEPDLSILTEMVEMIADLINITPNKYMVVVGGGQIARTYIKVAKQLEIDLGHQDHLGILVSRLNANILINAINQSAIDESPCYSQPAESLTEVESALQTHRVVVLGGLQPGQSTTAVAALCAEYCRASKIIYATNVDGVYQEDPRVNPSAKLLPEVTYPELRAITQRPENRLPGKYQIMDDMALNIIERSKIPATICLGASKYIFSLANGEVAPGTKIIAPPPSK